MPVMTADDPTQTVRYAGLARRPGAIVLDTIIIILFYVTLGLIVRFLLATGLVDVETIFGATPTDGNVSLGEMWTQMSVLRKLGVLAFAIAPSALYNAGFHASKWQATVGKRLLGIKVVDDHGARISLKRALGRYSAQYFLGNMSFGILSLISVGTIVASQKAKAVHDMIAGTEVIRRTA